VLVVCDNDDDVRQVKKQLSPLYWSFEISSVVLFLCVVDVVVDVVVVETFIHFEASFKFYSVGMRASEETSHHRKFQRQHTSS
jgi:hypothetical protein